MLPHMSEAMAWISASRLFRIGLAQIVERDAVAADQRPDPAGGAVGEVERLVRRQAAQQRNGGHRHLGDQPVVELAQLAGR